MPQVFVTRKERFNAAHKLWNPNWSEEQNFAVFGKCANKNWHGHNYHLLVTVKGEPSPETGFVCDLKKLSDVIKSTVISQLDHSNLNLDVPFLTGILPSTENLCIAVWKELKAPVEALGCTLHSVRIFETENNSCEYLGHE